jgi:hypothetical protein
VGSRGLDGVRRALIGGVSDSVVRRAHCPVLVMRSYKSADGCVRSLGSLPAHFGTSKKATTRLLGRREGLSKTSRSSKHVREHG